MLDRIGSLRRSKVITTYGPGAVIDFRAPGSGAPLSGVLAGLEWWDEAAPRGRAGRAHSQIINEPRLEKRLEVRCFRLPPVRLELKRWNKKDDRPESNYDVLPVVRFPTWLQCPKCDRIKPASQWACKKGDPERWCGACSEEEARVYAVPVRFIVACEDGHLDEFPWKLWIGCRCEREKLFLKTRGPGLAGKWVECRNEGCTSKPASLDGCFGREALKQRGMRCWAREPWLIRDDEKTAEERQCQKVPRALQRGASNVYWGETRSSLDIPPFSAELSHVFGRYWHDLKGKDPSKWPGLIDLLELDKLTGQPVDVLLSMLHDWKQALDADDPTNGLEWAEYVQFRQSGDMPVLKGEFQTEPAEVPAQLATHLESVVKAPRLREVRVQVGFTRIHPPSGSFGTATQQRGRIYLQKQEWLPAISMLGEGIFLRLGMDRLRRWERRDVVKRRVKPFIQHVIPRLRSPGDDRPVTLELVARFMLVHSLAHALMRRLSLDCGYSSSALRERLYAGEVPQDMAGILIHTGAPDSEGTLGGLVRQGQPGRLWETFHGVLEEMAWCSSDPVCITGTATLSSRQNGAACHACMLVPETSCQHFNVLLDRALLVGTSDCAEIGFFNELAVSVQSNSSSTGRVESSV